MKRQLTKTALGFIGIYVLICAGMYFGQENLIFRPVALPEDHVFTFSGDWEEIWLTAADSARVNGVLFRHQSPVGVVYFLHGNAGNIERVGTTWGMVKRNGYDMLTIDYRTYGKSTDPLSMEGIYKDADAGWQYLNERYGPDKIVLYGSSLGTGIATYLARNHSPKKLILQAPYTSIEDIARERFPWLPIGLLLEYPFPSVDNLKGLPSEVLILHGTEDRIIPYAHGKAMADAAPSALFVTLDGAGHNDLRRKPRFHQAFNTFLSRP